MKWGAPYILHWLWLLLPVGWLLLALVRRRDLRLRRLIDASMFRRLAPGYSLSRTRRTTMVWLLALGLCGIALARPQWGFNWQEVKRRGLDIIVVLDTSRSMLAQDIKPNRLQRAQWGIRDLVQLLKSDRIGLVSFAGSSFLQCPLTSDYAAFLMSMEDVYAGIIPKGGTRIGQALQTAIDSFEEKTDADRAIILVTDGEDHEPGMDKVMEQLKEKAIRVYAVGVGSLEGELIPHRDEQGIEGYYKDRQGNVVKTSLQEGLLEQLALQTGGMYVRSSAGDFGLQRIVERGLSRLKREEMESRMVKQYEERFVWALGLALLLLFVEPFVRGAAPPPAEDVS
jgi:Ca-activated chloride channel family protein